VADEAQALIRSLVSEAFPPSADAEWRIDDLTTIGLGRGIFSDIVRVKFEWRAGHGPASVVVKTPTAGPNGTVSIATGACDREALAYLELLPRSPVRRPACYVVRRDGAAASFVLEDLTEHRSVDQLVGLDLADTASVIRSLRLLHERWETEPSSATHDVRRATPTLFAPDALAAGVDAIGERWGDVADRETHRAFERLVANRDRLVSAFATAGPPTLCHGDPRADNLLFDAGGTAVLFDWQQIAIQFGEADLAWLLATSLVPATRRSNERALVSEFGTTLDRYRLAMVLPGLAVLLLAQRETTQDRTDQLVGTSIARIGAAIADLDVPAVRAGNPRG
jgi:hypothetical protein